MWPSRPGCPDPRSTVGLPPKRHLLDAFSRLRTASVRLRDQSRNGGRSAASDRLECGVAVHRRVPAFVLRCPGHRYRTRSCHRTAGPKSSRSTRARLQRCCRGRTCAVKAATAIRVAVSHYIVRSDDDDGFLEQLRHAVGTEPSRKVGQTCSAQRHRAGETSPCITAVRHQPAPRTTPEGPSHRKLRPHCGGPWARRDERSGDQRPGNQPAEVALPADRPGAGGRRDESDDQVDRDQSQHPAHVELESTRHHEGGGEQAEDGTRCAKVGDSSAEPGRPAPNRPTR